MPEYVIEVKGFSHDGIRRFAEDEEFAEAWEEGGIEDFLFLLEKREEAKLDVIELKPSIVSLVEWGLDRDLAEEVLRSEPSEHLGLMDAVMYFLKRRNGVHSAWPPTEDGWPLDMPTASIFFDSIGGMHAKRMGQHHRGQEKIKILFAHPEDATSLPVSLDNGRVPVFHATSWISAHNLESGVNVLMNTSQPRDFGFGFYLSVQYEYAYWRALHKANQRVYDKPVILVYSLPKDYQKMEGYTKLTDKGEWKRTVQQCRQHPYSVNMFKDIVEGPICAKGPLVNLNKQAEPLADFSQICVKTEDGLSMLRFEAAIFMPYKSRLPPDFKLF